MNMSKKFSELETGDKVWIIDSEADICNRTIKSIKPLGSRIKIDFNEGGYVTANGNHTSMMTNLICNKDFIFVYIGTDKNELIDNYVEKMKLMIDNTRKVVDEGLASMEKMQDKLVKIKESHD